MHNGLKIAITVLLLTLLVVVINPKSHKTLTISSSSDILVTSDNVNLKNQDIKLKNIDGINNTDTKLNNVDKLKNKKNIVSKNQNTISDEQRILMEYRRRRALPKEPVVYEYKSKNYDVVDNPQPKIKLDKKYQDELEFSGLANKTPVTEKTKQIETNTNTETLPEVLEQTVPQKESYTKKVKKQKSKTAYEETIVWNKWKSDLHNIIHNNVAYMISEDMPLGALYKYSFYVNRQGQISNINVKILFPGLVLNDKNKKALEEGKLAFKKVISKCSGKGFLVFPRGSQREFVKLELVVQIGPINIYTNPSDFNDLEKVFKFR